MTAFLTPSAGEHLFLYGTLLPGLVQPPQDAPIARLTPLGSATISGLLYDLGPYPALLLDPTGGDVVGELFSLPLDVDLLALLDEYEEFVPHLPSNSKYRRVTCVAESRSRGFVRSWVYEFNGNVSQAIPIPRGDYRAWRNRHTIT